MWSEIQCKLGEDSVITNINAFYYYSQIYSTCVAGKCLVHRNYMQELVSQIQVQFSVITAWMGDCHMLGFVLTALFPRSQVLCRLYKSHSKENMNWDPPCALYNCKIYYIRVLKILWTMSEFDGSWKRQNSPACTESESSKYWVWTQHRERRICLAVMPVLSQVCDQSRNISSVTWYDKFSHGLFCICWRKKEDKKDVLA